MSVRFDDVGRAGYPSPRVQCSQCGALVLGANRHIHSAWHEEQERQLQRVWTEIKALGGAQ